MTYTPVADFNGADSLQYRACNTAVPTVCDTATSNVDFYPTLLELCGVNSEVPFDGKSVVPLLKDPKATWTQPALMTYLRGNHAIRSDRWRYIRYADGSEELYDHQTDPNGWNNIASPRKAPVPPGLHTKVIARLKEHLPETNAPQRGEE